MRADVQGGHSRWTFDARDDYRSVLLQQGRVLLDADWNKHAEITRYPDETRTFDVVGLAGGPADGAGFGIVDAAGNAPTDAARDDLRITPGRYCVDGILCEARLPESVTGPGIPLTDQPYLAAIGADPELPKPAPDGCYALYLDVWTYHVTVDEDPPLRDSALGGPDTTTRARTVWQVRAVEINPDQGCSQLARIRVARGDPGHHDTVAEGHPTRHVEAEWDRPLVGRFVIDGWRIVAAGDPKLHLNGHANTVIDANGLTQLILPTDDEVTDGQFIQWFHLG